MQSLFGGADCSTSSNPLKQAVQRQAVDQSLFKDRFAVVPSGSARPLISFPATQLGQPGQVHKSQPGRPFDLQHLSDALGRTSSPTHIGYPPDWEAKWNTAPPRLGSPLVHPLPHTSPSIERHNVQTADWASSFNPNIIKGKGKAPAVEQSWHPQPPIGYQPRMVQPSQSFQSAYNPHMFQSLPPQVYDVKNDQREMEAAFERALADARANDQRETQVAPPEEEFREAKGDFEAVWESLRPEAERLNQLAQWENDFSQFTHDEDDLFDVLNDSLNRADVGQSTLDDQMSLRKPVEPIVETDRMAQAKPYVFADPNPYARMPTRQARKRAEEILETGGSLTEAILLLEHALQDYVDPDPAQVELWTMLGLAHAMDEREDKAMSAYEMGRKELDKNTSVARSIAGKLLTNLAISYVNEELDLPALRALHAHLLQFSQAIAGPTPTQKELQDSQDPWAPYQRILNSYLSLAQTQYAQHGEVDPDVQVGLGVMYYMMNDYEEARLCWVEKLNRQPDDYLMWNRLGATLANSGKSEEAVNAYRRALELRPTFTRAIFNLGIACVNIGVYREAAEHFLYALSTHPSDGKGDSTTIWTALRQALVNLDMGQLADQARPGTDLKVFKEAGFDF
ncbi:hypothetical protein M231_05073 [Tremella mesenterica]|uniref:Uncharacterized protein n=1 Tax=Tremella mesenterica TaxID=5217 RepID=A0A4Q1BIZ7_TREME|nr:hypothetical protein M231_05073 [Tremella mesenterica]